MSNQVLRFNLAQQTLHPRRDVVIDTSVLMAYLLPDRAAHGNARTLLEQLRSLKATLLLPAHAFFELVSAVMCEKRIRGEPVKTGDAQELLGLPSIIVTIDEAFVTGHLIGLASRGVFLDLKGGDMIFAALALGQALPLITEDVRQRKVVCGAGGRAFSIEEYLNSVQN